MHKNNFTVSLASALGKGGGRHHAPTNLSPENRVGTHCTGRWKSPIDGLVWCGKSGSHPDLTPEPSSPQRFSVPARWYWRQQNVIKSWVN